MVKIEINSLNEIKTAAEKFLQLIENRKIFAFKGKMGSGKTTFIKAVCECLGVSETINSPTFAIVNEYSTSAKKIIYHFDFYRINNIEEAMEIGVEEYLYSGNLCFLEWPENIAPLLPDDYVTVKITEMDNGKRIVELNL
ncbi:MAG: ATPase-like protein [Bacteroidetes bacterium]|nr:ATPase-like protein [Bacteroidota bacterium]